MSESEPPIPADAPEDFARRGFHVERAVLELNELNELRARADQIAADLDAYERKNLRARKALLDRHQRHVQQVARTGMQFAEQPARWITNQHLRRGDRIYPGRMRRVDREAIAAGNATGDPFSHESAASRLAQLSHLVDNDPVFREYAAHPRILAAVERLLAPNLKVWFDHVFSKPPYNDVPPYGGANRYHQDGFFHLSRRSVTCWIALDPITKDNGCLRFIPIDAGYGQFEFDQLGDGVTADMLRREVLVSMQPGDISFHDRWVVHATGPNETATARRGWAIHYADAESEFGNFGGAANAPLPFYQARDGAHIRNGIIHGNRDWHLVRGESFTGRI